MKQSRLIMLVLLFSPATAARYSRRHGRSLSAITKKSLAPHPDTVCEHKKTSHCGRSPLPQNLRLSPYPCFASANPPASTSRSRHSIIQIPSNP
jgi:hypothetical protein